MYARACLCCAPDRPRAPTTETTPARVARPVCYLTLGKNEREWGGRVGERFRPVRASGGERYMSPVPCHRRRVDVHRKCGSLVAPGFRAASPRRSRRSSKVT